MLQGKFRWKAILLLIICFFVLGAGWFGLNRLQRSSIHGRFLEQAKQAEESKQYARAARFLRLYLLIKGDDVATWIRYGTMLEDHLSKQTAKLHILNAYERILDLDKNNKAIQLRAAKLYIEVGKFDVAFPMLTSLETSNFADADVHRLLGEYSLARANEENDKDAKKRRYLEAENHYRESISRGPKDWKAYVPLVQLLRTVQDKPEDAEQMLDKLVRANPELPRAYILRSAFRQTGNDILVEVPTLLATLAGLSHAPAGPNPWLLAVAAPASKKQRDLVSAGEDLAVARTLAPKDVDVLLASAIQEVLMAREKGQPDPKSHFEAGRKYLEHAETLDKDDPRVLQQLVSLELAAERRSEAIEILRKAHKQTAKKEVRVPLLWDLANLLVDEGTFTEATEIVAELKKAGKEPFFLDYVRARMAMQQNKWSEAIDYLESARPLLLARNPGMALQADLFLGQCFEQLGEVGKQLTVFQRAQKLDPLNRAVQFGVARALAANNRLDEAIVESKALTGGRLLHARLLILKNFRTQNPNWSEVNDVLKDIVTTNATAAMEVAILQAEVAFAEAGTLEMQAKVDENKGIAEAAKKKHEQAKLKYGVADKFLEVAKTESPKNIDPWIAAAALAGRQRDEESNANARQILGEAQAKFPDRAEWRLAKLRYLPEKKEDALAFLRFLTEDIKSLERASQPAMLKGLAESYERVGEFVEAEGHWRKLAALEPNRLGVHLLAFDFFLRRDNEKGMLESLENIKRTELPDGPFGRFGDAQIIIHQLGKRAKNAQGETPPLSSEETAKLDLARRQLYAAATKDPTWSRIPLALAALAEIEGDKDLAIKHMRAAVDLGNRQIPLFKALVESLRNKGRFSEINEVLSKLQEVDLATDNFLQMKAAETSLFNKNVGQALERTQTAVAPDSKNFRDYVWQGQMFGALNETKKAESALRTAIKFAGDDPAPWVALVQIVARVGDVKKAIEIMEEMKSHVSPKQLTLTLAQCNQLIGLSMGQPKQGETDYLSKAEKFYIQALSEQPNDLDYQRTALQSIVMFYQNTGKPKEAEANLRQMLDPKLSQPAELVAWANRNVALALAFQNDKDNKRIDEAMDFIEKNLKKNPSSLEDLLVKGLLLASDKNKRDQAIKILEKVFELTPPTAEQMFVLANLYEDNQEWPKARDYTTRLLSKHPNDPKHQFYLANFIHKLMTKPNEKQQAKALIPALADTIRKNAGDNKRLANGTSILTNLLRAHPSLSPLIVAELGSTLRSSARNTGDKNNLLILADFLGNTGDPIEAIDLCEQLLNQKELSRQIVAVAVGAVSSIKSDDKQFDRVEAMVKSARAQSLEVKDAKLKEQIAIEMDLHLAIVKERRGDYSAAEATYRSILTRDAENVIVMNNLAFLLGLRGKYDEANGFIKKVITKVGPAAELLDTRASIHLAQGKIAEAETDIELVLKDARTPYRLFHSAQIQRAKGKTREALKDFTDARIAGLRESMLHPLEIPQYAVLLKLDR